MIGYLFRLVDTTWVLYTNDGNIYRGPTKPKTLGKLELEKIVRYAGFYRPSEVAMTVVDLVKEGKLPEVK
jgi:hypothetical protein